MFTTYKMRKLFLPLSIFLGLRINVVYCQFGSYSDGSSSTSSTTGSTSSNLDMRKGNIDYIFDETLEFYINYYNNDNSSNTNNNIVLDYDVTIMFYAQWCKNCHALASTYEQIARMLHAGTIDSKLIVGFFDCEYNIQHSILCEQIGIQHYPTIAYFNFAADKQQHQYEEKNNKKEKITNKTKKKASYKHITKFNGNWQYAESILDWIKYMKLISYYQRNNKWIQTFRRSILGLFLPNMRRTNHRQNNGNNGIKKLLSFKSSLPVGIPKLDESDNNKYASSTSSSSAGDDNDYQVLLKSYERNIDLLRRTDDMLQHKDAMIDTLLFPKEFDVDIVDAKGTLYDINIVIPIANKTYTDLYLYMYLTDTWPTIESMKNQSIYPNVVTDTMILTKCMSDIIYDYCSRIQTKFMYHWVQRNSNITYISETIYDQYENDLRDHFMIQEPYCTIVEACIEHDFFDHDENNITVMSNHTFNSTNTTANTNTNTTNTKLSCKPMTCPFHDEVACRYLTMCLLDDVYNDYYKSLDSAVLLSSSSSSSSNSKDKTNASSSSSDYDDNGSSHAGTTNENKMKKKGRPTTSSWWGLKK